MEIGALVGAANHLDNQAALIEQRFVADGRPQPILMRVDLALEVKW
jgi:hypothetical protein